MYFVRFSSSCIVHRELSTVSKQENCIFEIFDTNLTYRYRQFDFSYFIMSCKAFEIDFFTCKVLFLPKKCRRFIDLCGGIDRKHLREGQVFEANVTNLDACESLRGFLEDHFFELIQKRNFCQTLNFFSRSFNSLSY